jgi:hypothetical protein
LRDETGKRTCGFQKDVIREETEQEDFKPRDESGDRKQDVDDLKYCAGDFVVFTYESRIFA